MDDPSEWTAIPAAAQAVAVRVRVIPRDGDGWTRSAAVADGWEGPAAALLSAARDEGAIQPGARVRLEWVGEDGRPLGSRQKTVSGHAEAAAEAAAVGALGVPADGAALDPFGAAVAAGGPMVPLAAVGAMGAVVQAQSALIAALAAEQTRATRAASDLSAALGAELRRLAGAAVDGATAAHQLAVGQALEAGEARAAAAAAAATAEAAQGAQGEGTPAVEGLQAVAEIVRGGADLAAQLTGKKAAAPETVARVLRTILAKPDGERTAAVQAVIGALTDTERAALVGAIVGGG